LKNVAKIRILQTKHLAWGAFMSMQVAVVVAIASTSVHVGDNFLLLPYIAVVAVVATLFIVVLRVVVAVAKCEGRIYVFRSSNKANISRARC
jgi:hypothetical protein